MSNVGLLEVSILFCSNLWGVFKASFRKKINREGIFTGRECDLDDDKMHTHTQKDAT